MILDAWEKKSCGQEEAQMCGKEREMVKPYWIGANKENSKTRLLFLRNGAPEIALSLAAWLTRWLT